MIDVGQGFDAPVGNAHNRPVHLGTVVAGCARSRYGVEDSGLAAGGQA
jgi:hypothetical protein